MILLNMTMTLRAGESRKVNGAIVEKYLWQGLTRLLAVYDGSNNLKTRFEYADSRMPYAMTKSGVVYYLTYDQVGSLRIVADGSGNVIKRIDYDSFGSIINDNNPAFEVPFGFAGGLHDSDTGLVRFGYRDFDPETGRWTAKDPIGFAGGDTDLYGYCLNDPVNWIDPWGLLAGTVSGAVTGAVAGAVTGAVTGGPSGIVSGATSGFVAGAVGGALTGPLGGAVAGAASGMTGEMLSPSDILTYEDRMLALEKEMAKELIETEQKFEKLEKGIQEIEDDMKGKIDHLGTELLHNNDAPCGD